MRAHKLSALLTAAVLAVSGCAAVPEPALTEDISAAEPPAQTVRTAEAISDYIPRAELLDCLYYVDKDFHVHEERSVIYETEGAPLCGVAPHHLAAGHLIAGMYRTAAQREDIDTVVLIAPMHYDTANTLTTSLKGWNTAFGAVRNDTEITQMFIDRLGAAADDYMTEYDHSASSHIPFIRRYLPDAKVSVLLVSPKEHRDIPLRLSELLSEIAGIRNCFFAFSIDFSHYLDPDDADRHDAQTLDAVMNGDTAAIERFTNSNVDTPYCLSTFVRLSELSGCRITKADNSNTYRVGSLPYNRTLFPEGVTSYFVFLSELSG